MPMHAAKLARSGRLQRVYGVLSDGRWHSTQEIVLAAQVCAVNSIISELRANGCSIDCRQAPSEHGRVWLYRLSLEPSSGPGLRGEGRTAGSVATPCPRGRRLRPGSCPDDGWRLTPPPEDS